MIIDSHVHAGEYPQHFTKEFAVEMMGAVDKPVAQMSIDISTLLSEMDRAGVDRAFLLAFDAQRTLGVKVPNEYVALICQAHPDRFIGFGSVDAANPQAAAQVDHFATQLGLRGIKLAPAYLDLSPGDRRWYPVYEVAAQRQLPVLVHCGFTPIKQATQRFFPPMLLAEVVGRFPTVPVIVAHLGTPWVMPCLDLLVKHPNLHADISIFGWFQPVKVVAQVLSMARAKGVLDRVLWGTDYPMCTMEPFLKRIDQLSHDTALFPDGQALTEQERQRLLGGTAAQLIPGLAAPRLDPVSAREHRA